MYGSKYTCGKQYDPRFRPWFLTVRQRKPYEAVCVSVRARVRADGSAYARACHVHAYVCAYMGTLLHTLRVVGLAPVGHAASDRRPGA